MFSRLSVLRRSGNQVFASDPHRGAPLKQTVEPGAPKVLPPGGVTPPDPEK